MLIERGADVMAQNKDGETPLHLALQRGQLEVACMLIDRVFQGADLTARNKDGETPLHLASQGGQVEVVRMLIERGADVTAPEQERETPLHLASQRGQVEVARMLIERGADVTVQNKTGRHHYMASRAGNWKLPHAYRAWRGCDSQDELRGTPLHSVTRWTSWRSLFTCLSSVARTSQPRTRTGILHSVTYGVTNADTGDRWNAHRARRGSDTVRCPGQGRGDSCGSYMSFSRHERGQLEVAVMLIERGADLTPFECEIFARGKGASVIDNMRCGRTWVGPGLDHGSQPNRGKPSCYQSKGTSSSTATHWRPIREKRAAHRRRVDVDKGCYGC
jgi:hypothetical protein